MSIDLFKKSCEFVAGASHLGALPPPSLPEVAFIGRSNVGKSSLINAVTGRKSLARTSNTPGRTQQLNFFNLDGRMFLVDLPGYGYAKVSKEKVRKWTELIKTYLQGRVPLRRVFLLIDSRHGLKDSDIEMMDMLDKAAVIYQLVLTKTDKITAAELEAVLEATQKATKKHPACFDTLLCTSSEKKAGIIDLQRTIVELIS